MQLLQAFLTLLELSFQQYHFPMLITVSLATISLANLDAAAVLIIGYDYHFSSRQLDFPPDLSLLQPY